MSMTPVELVYEALERADCRPKGQPGSTRNIAARCPAHDDRTPSFQLSEGQDGRALVKCFRGCTAEEIVAALRLEMTDLFVPEREPVIPQRPRQVAEYVYTDEDGEPLIKVIRLEPKSFHQQRWEDGEWKYGLGDTRRVLYRLPRVLDALCRGEPVFVVEGEKDVEALERAGFTATTNLGGTGGGWRPEYTRSLSGASHRVVVVGDDDPPLPPTGQRPGHVHALEVWRKLTGHVGQVVARLPADGFKDVAEQLSAGVPFTSRTLRPIPMLAAEPALNGAAAAAGSALMLTARAMAARPAPKRSLQVVGPLVQRGMRTTIGAQTGEGKTTLGLQMMRCLVNREPFLDESWMPPRPGRALIVDLEQGEETVKARLREAGLAESDAVDVLWQPAGLALDSDAADQALLYDTVKRGNYDMVLLDPLYQMHRGNSNDERTAADLMRLVDGWARELNFALVIPMHARKPHPQAGKQFTIHDIAGSGSWNRNAEFVMGIQVMSPGASRLHFFKDRIGLGPVIGSHWWLSFDRAAGFGRTYKEDRDRIARELNAMLDRPGGVTEDELTAAGADQLWLQRMKRRAFVNRAGRWRATTWDEQTTIPVEDPS